MIDLSEIFGQIGNDDDDRPARAVDVPVAIEALKRAAAEFVEPIRFETGDLIMQRDGWEPVHKWPVRSSGVPGVFVRYDTPHEQGDIGNYAQHSMRDCIVGYAGEDGGVAFFWAWSGTFERFDPEKVYRREEG